MFSWGTPRFPSGSWVHYFRDSKNESLQTSIVLDALAVDTSLAQKYSYVAVCKKFLPTEVRDNGLPSNEALRIVRELDEKNQDEYSFAQLIGSISNEGQRTSYFRCKPRHLDKVVTELSAIYVPVGSSVANTNYTDFEKLAPNQLEQLLIDAREIYESVCSKNSVLGATYEFCHSMTVSNSTDIVALQKELQAAQYDIVRLSDNELEFSRSGELDERNILKESERLYSLGKNFRADYLGFGVLVQPNFS